MNDEINRSEYKKLVKEEWANSAVATSWARWHDKFNFQCRSITEDLLTLAQIRPGIRVLDLASGTGEPAITIAGLLGGQGNITATDLSAEMLTVARSNAEQVSLDNLSFLQAEAANLPFDDNTFDAITCRFGIMFFVDLPTTLQEIHRVLKPGGRMAFSAWGPPDSGTFAGFVLTPFFVRRPLPPPPPEKPSPMRFSRPGSLSDDFRRAGISTFKEDNVVLPFPWPGSPEEVWTSFYELAAPLRPYLDSFTEEERSKAFEEALKWLGSGAIKLDRTEFTVAINFITAEK